MTRAVPGWLAGRRWLQITLGVLAALIVGVGICEAIGWPFLVGPVQRKLAEKLERKVEFAGDEANPSVRIGLLGSVRVRAARIEIGAPSWSSEPYTFLAEDAALKLRYRDLWRMSRGSPLRVESLTARRFDGRIERLADGRASWQFGDKPKDDDAAAKDTALPSFGTLRVDDGSLKLRDAILPASVDATFSLTDSSDGAGGVPGNGAASAASSAAGGGRAAAALRAGSQLAASAASAAERAGVGRDAEAPRSAAAAASAPGGLQVSATGTYRKLPLRVELRTSGVLALVDDPSGAPAQPVYIDAKVGGAHLVFDGSARDPLNLSDLAGKFSLSGPSLAAAGDPLGLTLPTTPAFATRGSIRKEGQVWNALFERGEIGSSRLEGAFRYDPTREVPLLSGRLGGSRLLLADLGPAIGGEPRPGPAGVAPAREGGASKPGRVIPDRPFDLPSLRAMNANVLVDIGYLDLGTDKLDPLRPLRAHLTLAGGVLRISDIVARTGQGQLTGAVGLDGRSAKARYDADLRLQGVRLEQWLNLARNGQPYITGRLNAQTKVTGQGRSAAEILAGLDGGLRIQLRDATVSHLVMEAGGLDIAQAMGLLIKGDQPLRISCNVGDFAIKDGVMRPNIFVVATQDSTMWIDGTLSLSTEALDLRGVVAPKDFSPLTIRTPIHVRGTLGDPAVSVETGRLAGKAGAAALLALLHPLAAVLPFIDTGSREEAREADRECQALAKRGGAPLPSAQAAAKGR